jgi:Zn-dependent protease with chaperone function
MNYVLAFPVLAPLVCSLAVWAMHRRVDPSFGAISLSVTAVATTCGVATAAAFYAVAFVVPPDQAGWCRALLGHEVQPNLIAAIAAGTLAVVIAARVVVRMAKYRRELRALPAGGGQPLLVLDREDSVAYAHPGGKGSVVVSNGLMAGLSPPERLVVLAHERAHLDLHHSRHLLAGELARAGLPLAAPLGRAIRWCTERAADEATASVVGDRRLVASTIAKAALAASPPAFASINGSALVDRVEAMLAPPPTRSVPRSVLLATTALVAIGGAAYQAHHLAEVVMHVPGS